MTVLLTLDVVVVGVRLGVEEVVGVYWLVYLLLWLVLVMLVLEVVGELVFIVVFYSVNWLVFLKCLVA